MTDATTREDRYAHGRTVLDGIDGEAGGQVIDALNATFVAKKIFAERGVAAA